MTTLIPTDLTCPLCGRRFETHLIGSFSIGEKDSDFCPRFMGANPLPGMVHVCPDCGYTGEEGHFEPIDDERLRGKLVKAVESIATEEAPDGVQRYRRLALLLIQRGESSLTVADAYLKASWVARVIGEPGEEPARRKAIQYFELALAAKEVPGDQMPMVTYLVGELHRREGDEGKARTWLERARDQLPEKEPWLAKLVADQLARLTD